MGWLYRLQPGLHRETSIAGADLDSGQKLLTAVFPIKGFCLVGRRRFVRAALYAIVYSVYRRVTGEIKVTYLLLN